MKLGYYTLGTLALFVGAKVLGLVPNVGWGFILAPAFFHLGALFVLIDMYRQQRLIEDAIIAALEEEMKNGSD